MTICQKIFIAEYGAHGGCGKILHRTSVFSYEFYGGAHGGCGIIYYRTPKTITKWFWQKKIYNSHPSVSGLLKIERYTRHATHVKLAAFL